MRAHHLVLLVGAAVVGCSSSSSPAGPAGGSSSTTTSATTTSAGGAGGASTTSAGGAGGATTTTPAGDPWGDVAVKPAADLSADPDVLEVNLEAKKSSIQLPDVKAPTPTWTYDGTLPGPLLDAKVGDELVVHFTNHLDEDTSIHWHGVRVPNEMDGVMGVTPPTKPGETTEYHFKLKDAGLFWYHPHVRSDVQVNNGLYGAIRVRGEGEPVVDHEGVVVLDDLGVLPDGTIPTYLDDESAMMGRGGKYILFNGVVGPKLPWRAGGIERLRFVNAANGRFFNLRLDGTTFRVIGTDGGLVPKPYDADHVLIPPGKRYDVLVIPTGDPGKETILWDDAYDRGHDSGQDPPLPVATFRVSDEAPLTGRVLPTEGRVIERLPGGAVDQSIELNEVLDDQGVTHFTINGKSGMDVPPIKVDNGAIQRFFVKNESPMDHPFHLHGFFFQILERDGQPLADDRITDEDTVVVPTKSSMLFVTRFDAPGLWPYHCHILEHAEAGMIGLVEVAK